MKRWILSFCIHLRHRYIITALQNSADCCLEFTASAVQVFKGGGDLLSNGTRLLEVLAGCALTVTERTRNTKQNMQNTRAYEPQKDQETAHRDACSALRRDRLCMSFSLARVFDFEELHMLNKGHWNGLSTCRLGCRLGCHLGSRFGCTLG